MGHNMFNVAFTGSREYDQFDEHNNAIQKNIAGTIIGCPYIDKIYFGGAMGIDTDMLCRVSSIRPTETYYVKTIVVVVPDTLDKQHPYAQDMIDKHADVIIELKNPIHRSDWFKSYHTHDKCIVYHCTKLFAFPNEVALAAKKGGTWATMKFAKKNGHVEVPGMSWLGNIKETIVSPMKAKDE